MVLYASHEETVYLLTRPFLWIEVDICLGW